MHSKAHTARRFELMQNEGTKMELSFTFDDVKKSDYLKSEFVSYWVKSGFYTADCRYSQHPECQPWHYNWLLCCNLDWIKRYKSVEEMAHKWYIYRLPHIVRNFLEEIDYDCKPLRRYTEITPAHFIKSVLNELIRDKKVLLKLKQNMLDLTPDYEIITRVDPTVDKLNQNISKCEQMLKAKEEIRKQKQEEKKQQKQKGEHGNAAK